MSSLNFESYVNDVNGVFERFNSDFTAITTRFAFVEQYFYLDSSREEALFSKLVLETIPFQQLRPILQNVYKGDYYSVPDLHGKLSEVSHLIERDCQHGGWELVFLIFGTAISTSMPALVRLQRLLERLNTFDIALHLLAHGSGLGLLAQPWRFREIWLNTLYEDIEGLLSVEEPQAELGGHSDTSLD